MGRASFLCKRHNIPLLLVAATSDGPYIGRCLHRTEGYMAEHVLMGNRLGNGIWTVKICAGYFRGQQS